MQIVTNDSLGQYLDLKNNERIYAHTPNRDEPGKQPETLLEHSNLVMQYLASLWEENGLNGAVMSCINDLTVEEDSICSEAMDVVRTLFLGAVYWHDIGKINPKFQLNKMGNRVQNRDESVHDIDDRHSLLSALMYVERFSSSVEEATLSVSGYRAEVEQGFLNHVLYVFAYVISRHHTYLGHPEREHGEYADFEIKLCELVEDKSKLRKYIQYYSRKESLLTWSRNDIYDRIAHNRNSRLRDLHYGSELSLYWLTKLLFSSLVACDFYATHHYRYDKPLHFGYWSSREKVQKFVDAFHRTEVYNHVQIFRNNPLQEFDKSLNGLRAKLFLAVDEESKSREPAHLYELDAPTGSGKTYTSLNAALGWIANQADENWVFNKIIYVFPFNTLIEQTKHSLEHALSISTTEGVPSETLGIINSVTPIMTERQLEHVRNDEEKELDSHPLQAALLRRQMVHYPVTLTSHVQLFQWLFGVDRTSNLALAHLCNSIIILDEVQNYRNAIWKQTITFLESAAHYLNIRIVFMSATLPKLSRLLESPSTPIIPLVRNPDDYRRHSLFRERVVLDFSLLNNGDIDVDFLVQHVISIRQDRISKGLGCRILIELITKNTARKVYRKFLERLPTTLVFEMTGDDHPLLRQTILNQLGTKDNGSFKLDDVIVVCTQVIEAGTDIDMDVGWKHIAVLDSDEQFLGRINRNGKRSYCEVFFFSIDSIKSVYRGDFRSRFTAKEERYRSILQTKNYPAYYDEVLESIATLTSQNNEWNWSRIQGLIRSLDFSSIATSLQLIIDSSCTLYVSYSLVLPTGQAINGEELWNEWKTCMRDSSIEFAERMIQLSLLREKMNYFIYPFQLTPPTCKPPHFSEEFAGLYYVEDGQIFIEVDKWTGMPKFDREKYQDSKSK